MYLRQIMTKNITKFSMAIRKAIQYRKELDASDAYKIKGFYFSQIHQSKIT